MTDQKNDTVAAGEISSPSSLSSTHGTPSGERPGAIAGIVGLKCPECRHGKVFENWFLKMNPTCPVCKLKFEREPGYFLGAMYFSYALAIPPLTLLTLLQKWLMPERSMASCIIVATVIFLPLVVPIVRYSRVTWLYFDRYFDPQEPQAQPPDQHRTDRPQ
jgi:uncharacterized protein (DUF983 family)